MLVVFEEEEETTMLGHRQCMIGLCKDRVLHCQLFCDYSIDYLSVNFVAKKCGIKPAKCAVSNKDIFSKFCL